MGAIADFFSEIRMQIQKIQDSLREIQESWEAFKQFWDLFFTLVPWEVILLLLFCVILVSLLNSLSPTSPKANITISVILLCSAWFYLWGIFSKDASFLKILVSGLYILVPVHALGLFQWGFQRYRNYQRKKSRLSPRDWQTALHGVSQSYQQLMQVAYEDLERLSVSDLNARILSLEESLEGIRKLAPKK